MLYANGDIKDFLICFNNQLAQYFFDNGIKCVTTHYEEFLSNKIQQNGSFPSCDSEDDLKSVKIFGEYYKNILLNYSKHESGLTCQVPCQTDSFQLTSTRLGVTPPELGKNKFKLEPSALSWKLRKVVIEGVACSRHLARKSRAQILAVWFQTDLQAVKQNLFLAPDQKIVRLKKVANDQKINFAL